MDEGSFSAAVKKLHISQPALSLQLKKLEERLGCELLERTARGVRPTAIGKLVYEMSLDILARAHKLRVLVQKHLELGEGKIDCHGEVGTFQKIILPIMKDFSFSYPKIDVYLREESREAILNNLEKGKTDIAIFIDDDTSIRNLNGISEKILTVSQTLYLIASPNHSLSRLARALEKVNKKLLPFHLNGFPLIMWADGKRNFILKSLEKKSITPTIVSEVISEEVMLSLVAQEQGLAFVEKVPPQMEVLSIEEWSLECQYTITSPKRILAPAAHKFLSYIYAHYGSVYME